MGFKFEPVAWLAAIQSALALLVAFPGVELGADTAAWLLTITSAVFAAVEAFMVRPFTPAALAGAIRTLLTAVVMFGFPISDEFSAALIGFATLVYGFLVRGQVSPKAGQVLAWENPTRSVR